MDNILKQNRFDNVTHRVYTHSSGRGVGADNVVDGAWEFSRNAMQKNKKVENKKEDSDIENNLKRLNVFKQEF